MRGAQCLLLQSNASEATTADSLMEGPRLLVTWTRGAAKKREKKQISQQKKKNVTGPVLMHQDGTSGTGSGCGLNMVLVLLAAVGGTILKEKKYETFVGNRQEKKENRSEY